MKRQFAETKAKGYYFQTLLTIVKCLDIYGFSLENPGNEFCHWVFNVKGNIRNIEFWHLDVCCVAERVLHTLLKYGYTFTGELPCFSRDSSCTITILLITYIYFIYKLH